MVELPLPEKGERKFDLGVSLEIPAHVFSDHDPWSRLQVLARLGSPDEEVNPELLENTDAIRRAALAAAHRAKIRRRAILRTAVDRARASAGVDWEAIGAEFGRLLDEALAELRRSRDSIGTPRPDESSRLARERKLAAEFLSNQVIELISRVQRAVDHLAATRRPMDESLKAPLRALRRSLAQALAEEYAYRRGEGFPSPRSADPVELDRYVSRVSSLKKHFQEILFLQIDSEHVDKRMRYLASTMAAILAALVVIPLTAIATGSHGLGGLGFGLTTSFLIVVLAYGVRERIKEGVRGWLTARAAKVGRRTTLSTPPRPPDEGFRVARVRETFSTRKIKQSDPVHPDLPSSLPMICLRYQMQGTVAGSAEVPGSQRAKLVFRYDLTPLFSRLHDPVEEVPILDETGERLSFAEAPRLYRFPIEARLFDGVNTETFSGKLLAHKYGLVRIEPNEPEAVPLFEERAASLPAGMMRRR